jgi:hypothetical protein
MVAERQGFKRSIQVTLAISCVLARAPRHGATEHGGAGGLDEVFAAYTAIPKPASHPKLEYNLACYFAVTKDWSQAVPLFLTLRAVIPDLAQVVLADPDVADLPQIADLFTSAPPTTAAAVAVPSAPPGVDDLDRDEPT